MLQEYLLCEALIVKTSKAILLCLSEAPEMVSHSTCISESVLEKIVKKLLNSWSLI